MSAFGMLWTEWEQNEEVRTTPLWYDNLQTGIPIPGIIQLTDFYWPEELVYAVLNVFLSKGSFKVGTSVLGTRFS